MKDILYFIAGVAIGSVLALFLAPKSGEELRGDIQTRANADLQRLQQSYEQKMQDLNQKIETLQAQMKQKSAQQGEATGEAATNTDVATAS